MSLPELTVATGFLAALPLLLVLFLMMGRNWSGSWAGIAGWTAAILIALFFFGADFRLLWVSFGKALLLALFVLYIIWMALLLYHVVNEAGAIAVIGRELPGLTGDRPGQALLLGWLFGSFLQGASGFGVPAAVVAPLLVSVGFAANVAVVVALLGHAWAVTYGSLGSSFFALVATVDVPGEQLAGPAAILLALCCLACGLGTLWATDGWRAVRRRWPFLLALSGVMGGVQWALAVAGFWNMAAFGAGMVGLAVAILLFRFSLLDGWRPAGEPVAVPVNFRLLAAAFFPYLLLTIIIVLGQTALQGPLAVWQLNYDFPEVVTRFGWRTPAGPGQGINVFGHAGALLLYGSLAAFIWFRWRGSLRQAQAYEGGVIVRKTLRGSISPTISIVALLAMSVTMQHAGMTQLLAEIISANAGPLFAPLSPFIGALGAFMTGSNTNSNVVFGQLQQQTAMALQLSVAWILAGQTAGGAIGGLFAPAKVIVGCSTVAGAAEGQVLKLATIYGLSVTAVVALAVWLLA